MTDQERIKEIRDQYDVAILNGDYDISFLLKLVDKLTLENKDFREALDFYRDELTWISKCGNLFIGDMGPELGLIGERFQGWNLDGDYGKKAYAVLNKHSEEK